jgi:hypothetical protein
MRFQGDLVASDHHVPGGDRRGFRVVASGWVGSSFGGLGEARIVLRGEIDSDALKLVGRQLDGFLAARTRFVTLDAPGVTGADARLVEVLGAAQRRLAPGRGLLTTPGRGLLTTVGLHPHVLPPGAASGREPDAAGAAEGAAATVAEPAR